MHQSNIESFRQQGVLQNVSPLLSKEVMFYSGG